MTTFVIAWITFLFGLEIAVWLTARRAPRCTCDDPRCGGGCIDWEEAA